MEQITITAEQRAEIARCIQGTILRLQQRRRWNIRRTASGRPWSLAEAKFYADRGRRVVRLAEILKAFDYGARM